MAQIEVLTGIAGSGKTGALLKLFRSALSDATRAMRPGRALWLAPAQAARDAIRRRLFDGSLPVAFGPNVLTFEDFADRILKFLPDAANRMSGALQRTALRSIVQRLHAAGQLAYFGPICATSGFLDVVTGLIAELKRAEVWPEHYEEICAGRGRRQSDRELALIYRDYQAMLQKQNLYDYEGRFWSARQALREGRWGPAFADLALVVVDGFTDFTQAQYGILGLLANHAERLVVSLPLEAPLERADLFSGATDVIAALKQQAQVTVHYGPQADGGSGEAPAGLARLARGLFSDPRRTVRTEQAQGIEIISAAGPGAEMTMVAARIKRLLLDGTSPEEIVVAVRDLDECRDLVEDIFGEAGIPIICDVGEPLASLPLARALVGVLRLELEDWSFRRLSALLASNFFHPEWPEYESDRAAPDALWLLRTLGLAGDRAAILARVEHFAAAHSSEDTAEDAAGARRGMALLRRLSEATERLRKPHRLEDWAAVVGALAGDLGLLAERAGRGDEWSSGHANDLRNAWSRLVAILFDAARAAAFDPEHAAPLSLAQFAPQLIDLLSSQRVAPAQPEGACVRITSPEEVRHLDVPYLFLAGLTERSFPRRRGDDCLLSEADRRDLVERGVAIGHRAASVSQEMLLFYRVVTRARKQLVLSYPSSTAEGQPLSPSPYVEAVEALFEPLCVPHDRDDQLDPVPPVARLLSAADVRTRSIADALAGEPALLSAAAADRNLAAGVRSLMAAVAMNVLRFHTPGFTHCEGRLQHPRHLEQIARRFSNEHEFSPTHLEEYAKCPFRYFVSQVLSVVPQEHPEAGTDTLRRGTVLHAILAELHRSPIEDEKFAAEFVRLLEEQLSREPERSAFDAALRGIERRLLSEWGAVYAAQWAAYQADSKQTLAAPFVPTAFELAFGSTANEGATDATGKSGPSLVLGSGENETRLGGRIDRIDVGRTAEGAVFTVIDYKTGRGKSVSGRATLENVAKGRALQLAIYALAIVRLKLLGIDVHPYQIGYWRIPEPGFVPGIKPSGKGSRSGLRPMSAEEWNSVVGAVEETVPKLASRIRAARFDVFNEDDDCTKYCPYKSVCRVQQIRAVSGHLPKRPDT
jgi:ATP-dependent helicase/nuclease subunit B